MRQRSKRQRWPQSAKAGSRCLWPICPRRCASRACRGRCKTRSVRSWRYARRSTRRRRVLTSRPRSPKPTLPPHLNPRPRRRPRSAARRNLARSIRQPAQERAAGASAGFKDLAHQRTGTAPFAFDLCCKFTRCRYPSGQFGAACRRSRSGAAGLGPARAGTVGPSSVAGVTRIPSRCFADARRHGAGARASRPFCGAGFSGDSGGADAGKRSSREPQAGDAGGRASVESVARWGAGRGFSSDRGRHRVTCRGDANSGSGPRFADRRQGGIAVVAAGCAAIDRSCSIGVASACTRDDGSRGECGRKHPFGFARKRRSQRSDADLSADLRSMVRGHPGEAISDSRSS